MQKTSPVNRRDLILLLLVVASFGILGQRLWAMPAQEPTVGSEAVEIRLPTHDGKIMTLSKYEGHRGVVLVFFSVNCPGCLAEVPSIKDFVKKSRDAGVVVFGVNLNDPPPVVTGFIDGFEPNYRILLDQMGEAGHAYNIYTIPHIVAVDAAGVVRFRGGRLPSNTDGLIATLTAPLDESSSDTETVTADTEGTAGETTHRSEPASASTEAPRDGAASSAEVVEPIVGVRSPPEGVDGVEGPQAD